MTCRLPGNRNISSSNIFSNRFVRSRNTHRRAAFRFSENDLRHWLLLLFADRVNVGEGLIEDLSRGYVPNIYREMGGAAELQHNPRGAATKALAGAALLGAAFLLLRQRRGEKLPRR